MSGLLAENLQRRRLHHLEGQLGRFFSPGMRNIVMNDPDHADLRSATREVTVMFFDLRGFSAATEEAQQDDQRVVIFQEHFDSLQRIMTAVTERVFDTDEIVADYQGDAVLAIWGAPIPQPDHARRAVTTAQAVLEWMREHAPTPIHASSNYRYPCGIGISSGRILAGNIGVGGLVHYQTIGRCINEASRLEGLTKYFRVPILMTEATRQLLGDNSQFLLRRVARVRPAGMHTAIPLHELLVQWDPSEPLLSAEQIATYESALSAFESGRLEEAEDLLTHLPRKDPARRFLADRVSRFMMDGMPPTFDGVITFSQK